MGATNFYKKDGSISSIRNSYKVGNQQVETMTYLNDRKGGITFRTKTITTRLNSMGHAIGTGNGLGMKQYYNGKMFGTKIPKY